MPPSPIEASAITVSLEWAKKLKEAGWQQETSYFSWICDLEGGMSPIPINYEIGVLAHKRPMHDKWTLDAPTAEEILRRLPHKFVHGESHALYASATYRGHPHGVGWIVGYRNFAENIRHPEIDGQVSDSLTNAAAAMYCYLAENKLLPSI